MGKELPPVSEFRPKFKPDCAKFYGSIYIGGLLEERNESNERMFFGVHITPT